MKAFDAQIVPILFQNDRGQHTFILLHAIPYSIAQQIAFRGEADEAGMASRPGFVSRTPEQHGDVGFRGLWISPHWLRAPSVAQLPAQRAWPPRLGLVAS